MRACIISIYVVIHQIELIVLTKKGRGAQHCIYIQMSHIEALS